MTVSPPKKAKILTSTPQNLDRAAEAIRQGGLVAMPTETVYGLAGDVFRIEALARIFKAKERPTVDPLIVHVSREVLRGGLLALNGLRLVNTPALGKLAWHNAETLIARFWPGPLTLVLPKLEDVPDLATSGLPTVAVRMPRHPVAQGLLDRCGTPLAAPSANRFGQISPTLPGHVQEELGDRIEWILDGGPCEVGLESTVVSIDPDGHVTLLRPGGIPRLDIEMVISAPLGTPSHPAVRGAAGPASPGMLESHYAPSKPLFLLPGKVVDMRGIQIPEAVQSSVVGLLLITGAVEPAIESWRKLTGRTPVITRTLSPSGSLPEAARSLFSTLRELDHSSAELLVAEPCLSDEGLAHAIGDRLRRASSPTLRGVDATLKRPYARY